MPGRCVDLDASFERGHRPIVVRPFPSRIDLVASVMTLRATQSQFVDDRAVRLFERRIVVVFEEVGRATVDADAVASR